MAIAKMHLSATATKSGKELIATFQNVMTANMDDALNQTTAFVIKDGLVKNVTSAKNCLAARMASAMNTPTPASVTKTGRVICVTNQYAKKNVNMDSATTTLVKFHQPIVAVQQKCRYYKFLVVTSVSPRFCCYCSTLTL